MPTLITNIQNSFGGLGTTIREEKKIKAIQIGKEVKLSLFADDMILYKENFKDVTRKLLALINENSKVKGYKVNTKKSLALLYTNNEISGEIKENNHFHHCGKRIKHLGINLPKETKHRHQFANKGLYSQRYGFSSSHVLM